MLLNDIYQCFSIDHRYCNNDDYCYPVSTQCDGIADCVYEKMSDVSDERDCDCGEWGLLECHFNDNDDTIDICMYSQWLESSNADMLNWITCDGVTRENNTAEKTIFYSSNYTGGVSIHTHLAWSGLYL